MPLDKSPDHINQSRQTNDVVRLPGTTYNIVMGFVQHFQRNEFAQELSLKNEPKTSASNVISIDFHLHFCHEQGPGHDRGLCHHFEHESSCAPVGIRVWQMAVAKQAEHEIQHIMDVRNIVQMRYSIEVVVLG